MALRSNKYGQSNNLKPLERYVKFQFFCPIV